MNRAAIVTAVVVVALFTFSFVVGRRGLNFGEHWDEWYAQFGTENAVKNLELFPGDFTYNGVYFDLAFLPVADDVISAIPDIFKEISKAPTRPMDQTKYPAIAKMQANVLPFIKKTQYILQTRRLFLFLSLFIIVGAAAAARRLWPERAVPAAAAAAVVGTSWEVGYHARYIAVDSLMGALSALMFGAIAWAMTTSSPVKKQVAWMAAAVCGGLAFGCKVTGIVYCLPIGVGAFLAWPSTVSTTRLSSLLVRLRGVAFVASIFVASFLLSTPGFLRDPVRFAAGVYHTSATYGRGKFGYATAGLVDHVVKFFSWLFVDTPSPFFPFSLLLCFFAGLGARRLWWRSRPFAATLLVFSAGFFFIILKAGQLNVRNGLPLVPVFALCVGAGVDVVIAAVSGVWRAVIGSVVVAGFLANAGFEIYAAETVRKTTRASILAETGAWLTEHHDRELWVGPRLYTELKTQLSTTYSCTAAVGPIPAAARVALFFDEHPRKRWQSSKWDDYEKHFTSLETNITYYINWRAKHWKNRTVVMPAKTTARNGMRLKGYWRCLPAGMAAATPTLLDAGAGTPTTPTPPPEPTPLDAGTPTPATAPAAGGPAADVDEGD